MKGVLRLKHKVMAEDTRPIDPTCSCMVWSLFLILFLSLFYIYTFFSYSLFGHDCVLCFITGMSKLYKGLHSLSCYKRCYGISAPVISQFILYDAGTNTVTRKKNKK